MASLRSRIQRHSKLTRLTIECLEERDTPSVLGSDFHLPPAVEPPTTTVASPLPEPFLGVFQHDKLHAAGERPLILLKVNFDPFLSTLIAGSATVAYDTDKDLEYYRKLIFDPNGSGDPNIKDFFLENSKGKFTWKEVYSGQMNFPPYAEWYKSYNDDAHAQYLRLVTALGINFKEFDVVDANGRPGADGIVGPDELGILAITNVVPTWGQAWRGNAPIQLADVQLAAATCFVGHKGNFATIAHELSHVISTLDMYGVDKNGAGPNAYQLSLLGATDLPTPYLMDTYHLDPWHKIALGWEKPQIYFLTQPGSVRLQPTSAPVILFDITRPVPEYYIIEYRDKIRPYDDDVLGDRGVAFWYVQTDQFGDDGSPVSIPKFIFPGSPNTIESNVVDDDERVTNDEGTNIIGPGGDNILDSIPVGNDELRSDLAILCSTQPRIVRTEQLFHNSNGLITPQWFDGSDTGLRIRISDDEDRLHAATVEWGYREEQFVPQIDSVANPSAWLYPDQNITLRGTFGVSPRDGSPKIISLRNAQGEYDLSVGAWENHLITVKVPHDIPRGDYDLVIYSDASRTRASNVVHFGVAPAGILIRDSRSRSYTLSIVGTSSDDQIRLATTATGQLLMTEIGLGRSLPIFYLSDNLLAASVSADSVIAVEIRGYLGDDQFFIGGGDFARTLQTTLQIDGGAGTNGLTIEDALAATKKNVYTLTATTFNKKASRDNTITYGNIKNITLNTTAFEDEVTVSSTALRSQVNLVTGAGKDVVTVQQFHGTMEVSTGEGDDTISLASDTRNLELVSGLVISAGSGRDALKLDDRNNPYSEGGGKTFTIESGKVERSRRFRERSEPVVVTFTGVDDLSLLTGIDNDTINVENTQAATTIDTGRGEDTVRVTPTLKNLEWARGLSVQGGSGGLDKIELFDQNNPYVIPIATSLYTMTATSLSRNFLPFGLTTPIPFSIGFTALENVSLMTASREDVFLVQGTPGNTTIQSGAGLDQFVVGPDLTQIRGVLTIDAAAVPGETNVLTIDDRSGPLGILHHNQLGVEGTRTTLDINLARRISAGGISGLVFYGSAAGDLFSVRGNLVPTAIYAGGGNDQITVATTSGSLHEALLASLTISGDADSNTLTVNDANAGIGTKYTMTSSTIHAHGRTLLTYNGLADLNLMLSNYSDILDFTGNPFPTRVSANGGGGSDYLTGSNLINLFVITGLDSGLHTYGTTSYASFENLLGGLYDRFVFQGGSVSGTIDGQEGTDTLVYSAWTVPVHVSLPDGSAPAVGGGAPGKVISIENVFGGIGDDVLIGDDHANAFYGSGGNDQLFGGDGHDILSGGAGTDFLFGGAGEDFLIGGSLIFTDPVDYGYSFSQISEHWALAGTYLERVERLRNDDLLAYPIEDDADSDELWGQGDRDWFWGMVAEARDHEDDPFETISNN